jgi:hypothetical protein
MPGRKEIHMAKFIVREAQTVTRIAYFEHTIEAETFEEAKAKVRRGETLVGDVRLITETDGEYGNSGFGEDDDEALEALEESDRIEALWRDENDEPDENDE